MHEGLGTKYHRLEVTCFLNNLNLSNVDETNYNYYDTKPVPLTSK